ncbi:MAG: OmpA family protein [Candidatus Omnitrophica bacterium]|nr:OmpA family protein [Candidatus Omnitrophota bacterium]MBU2044890.1 OmpA family protein [Candidatus Omnitrophota bacterium]MBU2250950.1 OmpA family protein [Candidatus Omnitrophota bacterium]MBU2266094.1 OmpA family protein [Candidatus Omnitrophota bacterium]MBU2473268.1 OmpA family protein [Candidatus Omnitrophota bacterium]
MRKNLILLVLFLFVLNGCAVVFQKGRRSDIEKIQTLQSELDELRSTQRHLAEKLSQEIKDKQVRLQMLEKGLVITFVAEVLFDSGKEKLRSESLPILDKVIAILKQEVPNNNIGIEGHTDNEPIKYSRWKTNWELSAQRALNVLYYLEQNGVSSSRLSAIGYGEHHPESSNDTVEGRQTNRRVEIVILPKSVKKIEPEPIEIREEELK